MYQHLGNDVQVGKKPLGGFAQHLIRSGHTVKQVRQHPGVHGADAYVMTFFLGGGRGLLGGDGNENVALREGDLSHIGLGDGDVDKGDVQIPGGDSGLQHGSAGLLQVDGDIGICRVKLGKNLGQEILPKKGGRAHMQRTAFVAVGLLEIFEKLGLLAHGL